MNKFYRFICDFVEKHGKQLEGWRGLWVWKCCGITLSYEVSWFIDHNQYDLHFALFGKRLFSKFFEEEPIPFA